VNGARAVSTSVLPSEPSDDVRFFVVWVNRGLGDNRGAVDDSILADARVTQYWDGDGLTGTTFAARDLGGLGPAGFLYDVYWVFGPDATWDDAPGPVAGAGRTVVAQTDRLLREIRAQL
jgi:hypothetical protein